MRVANSTLHSYTGPNVESLFQPVKVAPHQSGDYRTKAPPPITDVVQSAAFRAVKTMHASWYFEDLTVPPEDLCLPASFKGQGYHKLTMRDLGINDEYWDMDPENKYDRDIWKIWYNGKDIFY